MTEALAEGAVGSPRAPAYSDERHLVTCEYPPQVGGVADYTRIVARELARRGEQVHVWTMAVDGVPPRDPGVHVHAAGHYRPHDLRALDAALDAFAAPRRLFVQWVPHGYGYRSLNVAFCRWVRRRAREHGDLIDLMVHEPFLEFRLARPRQSAAALIHRAMLVILCSAARRIWTSTPSFVPLVRPYGLGRDLQCRWLPVPSSVARVDDPGRVSAIRERLGSAGPLIGHFGTYNRLIAPVLRAAILDVLTDEPGTKVLLLGRGGDRFAEEITAAEPAAEGRVTGPGVLTSDDVSMHLQACDLFVQPYPDGVSSRRTTMMALLAHGCPTVTTDGIRTEGWWRARTPVRLVPVGDSDALRRMTVALIRDPQERARLAAAASALYEDRFTPAHGVDRFADDSSPTWR